MAWPKPPTRADQLPPLDLETRIITIEVGTKNSSMNGTKPRPTKNNTRKFEKSKAEKNKEKVVKQRKMERKIKKEVAEERARRREEGWFKPCRTRLAIWGPTASIHDADAGVTYTLEDKCNSALVRLDQFEEAWFVVNPLGGDFLDSDIFDIEGPPFPSDHTSHTSGGNSSSDGVAGEDGEESPNALETVRNAEEKMHDRSDDATVDGEERVEKIGSEGDTCSESVGVEHPRRQLQHSCTTEYDALINSGTIEKAIKKNRGPSTFYVSAGILKWCSGYFEICLKSSAFVEARDNIVRLPEEEPRTFALFIRWIHERRFFPQAANDEDVLDWSTLTDLWIFGDRRHIPMLQNTVMDLLYRKMCRKNQFLSAGAIRKIWEETLPSSEIGWFVVQWIRRLRYLLFPDEIEWWDPDNAEDVVKAANALRSKCAWNGPSWRIERRRFRCHGLVCDKVWNCWHINSDWLPCAVINGVATSDWEYRLHCHPELYWNIVEEDEGWAPTPIDFDDDPLY